MQRKLILEANRLQLETEGVASTDLAFTEKAGASVIWLNGLAFLCLAPVVSSTSFARNACSASQTRLPTLLQTITGVAPGFANSVSFGFKRFPWSSSKHFKWLSRMLSHSSFVGSVEPGQDRLPGMDLSRTTETRRDERLKN